MKNKLLTTFVFVTFGFVLMTLNSSKIFAGSCTYVGVGGGTWSTGGNWSGTCAGAGGIPTDGDDVIVPNNISTNNDISGLDLVTLTFTGSPGGTLSGSAFSVSSSISGSFPHIITPQITLVGGAPVSLSTNAYNGGIVITGMATQLVAAPSVLPWGISSNISGDGSISLNNISATHLSGGGTGFTGDIYASGNTQLDISGSWPLGMGIYLSDGATFFGSGASGAYVYTDGTANISPSRLGVGTPEYLLIAEMDLNPGDTMSFLIGGTVGGTDYDTIHAYGYGPDFTGVNLSLALTYTPAALDTYTLLTADGGITGNFNGLPHGSRIDIGGQSFIIEYTVGSVQLKAVGGLIDFFVNNYIITPSSPTSGQPVVVSAVLGSNYNAPTGTAELFDGTTSLGTVAVVGGNVTFNLPSGLSAGAHSLTLHYSGDLIYPPVTSDPLVLNVVVPLSETGIHFPIAPLLLSMVALIGLVVLVRKKY